MSAESLLGFAFVVHSSSLGVETNQRNHPFCKGRLFISLHKLQRARQSPIKDEYGKKKELPLCFVVKGNQLRANHAYPPSWVCVTIGRGPQNCCCLLLPFKPTPKREPLPSRPILPTPCPSWCCPFKESKRKPPVC